MLLLSFAWCPGVRRTQLEARCKPAAYADARDVLLGGSNGVLPPAPPEKPNGHSARAKATIIASLVKLLLIPFVAAGFFKWLIADIFGGNLLHEGFDNFNVHHSAFPYFMVQIFASLVGYCLGCLVCSMCMQKLAFAFPLVLSTIVSVAITPVLFPHSTDINNVAYLIILAVLLWLSQFLSTGYYLFKGQSFIMAKESSLFWLPAYNGESESIHAVSSCPALRYRNLIATWTTSVPYQLGHVHTWSPSTSAWVPAQNGAVFRHRVPKI